MNLRRRLAIVGIVIGISLFVIGTTGVSTVSLDRGVSVSVAEDSEARLGIEITCIDNSSSVATTITNRFESDIDLTLRSGDVTVTIEDLDSRDSERITFPKTEAGTVVSIEALSDGATVRLYREIPSECAGPV